MTPKGHYCGKTMPPNFHSGTGMDIVQVIFKSDEIVAFNGFRLEYVVHGKTHFKGYISSFFIE